MSTSAQRVEELKFSYSSSQTGSLKTSVSAQRINFLCVLNSLNLLPRLFYTHPCKRKCHLGQDLT